MNRWIMMAMMLLLGAVGLVIWKNTDQKPLQDKGSNTVHQEDVKKRPSAKVDQGHKLAKWNALMDDELEQHTRLNLARTINREMSDEEIDLLLESLTRTPAPHAKETWWVVMNEIMEQMRKKGVAEDRLGPALTALVKDPKQTEMVRDYAVQHLSLWVAPVNGAHGEPSSEVVIQALHEIAATITDPSIAHTSIPGTAIMALTTSSKVLDSETMSPIWEKLDPAISSMLEGEISVPLSTRTTLLQSLALRGSKEHLPRVQSMARDETVDPSLRLSSIAALGIYRSKQDKDYLNTLAEGSSRYRYAAKAALKRISQEK